MKDSTSKGTSVAGTEVNEGCVQRDKTESYMLMAKSTNEWIKVAWKRETLKDENSMIDEAVARWFS